MKLTMSEKKSEIRDGACCRWCMYLDIVDIDADTSHWCTYQDDFVDHTSLCDSFRRANVNKIYGFKK